MFHSAVLLSISFCVYRACFTHLLFRQIELQSMFMVLWSIVPLWIIKKIMHAYIVILSGSILNVSTVYLNDIWHLIGRYLSKPVLGGHPVLSGHYSIPRECPLNTGFTVVEIMAMPLNDWNPESKFHFQTLESGEHRLFHIIQMNLMCYVNTINYPSIKVQLLQRKQISIC